MKDIGVTRERPDIASPTKATTDKYYPTVTLTENQLVELKSMEIGKTKKIAIEVKLTGKRMSEEWDEVDSPHYTLEIRKVGDLE